MTGTQRAIIIGVTAAVMLAIIIISVIRDSKKNKTTLKEDEDRRLAYKPCCVTVHAEVLDMACVVRSVPHQGYKLPRAERGFFVKLRDDEGKIYDLSVEESIYDGFEIGQTGSLTLVDGELNSFCLDEE